MTTPVPSNSPFPNLTNAQVGLYPWGTYKVTYVDDTGHQTSASLYDLTTRVNAEAQVAFGKGDKQVLSQAPHLQRLYTQADTLLERQPSGLYKLIARILNWFYSAPRLAFQKAIQQGQLAKATPPPASPPPSPESTASPSQTPPPSPKASTPPPPTATTPPPASPRTTPPTPRISARITADPIPQEARFQKQFDSFEAFARETYPKALEKSTRSAGAQGYAGPVRACLTSLENKPQKTWPYQLVRGDNECMLYSLAAVFLNQSEAQKTTLLNKARTVLGMAGAKIETGDGLVTIDATWINTHLQKNSHRDTFIGNLAQLFRAIGVKQEAFLWNENGEIEKATEALPVPQAVGETVTQDGLIMIANTLGMHITIFHRERTDQSQTITFTESDSDDPSVKEQPLIGSIVMLGGHAGALLPPQEAASADVDPTLATALALSAEEATRVVQGRYDTFEAMANELYQDRPEAIQLKDKPWIEYNSPTVRVTNNGDCMFYSLGVILREKTDMQETLRSIGDKLGDEGVELTIGTERVQINKDWMQRHLNLKGPVNEDAFYRNLAHSLRALSVKFPPSDSGDATQPIAGKYVTTAAIDALAKELNLNIATIAFPHEGAADLERHKNADGRWLGTVLLMGEHGHAILSR